MLKKEKNFLGKIFAIVLSCFIWCTLQAGSPLWTIVPASGSNPIQTVPENRTASVQYVVKNQSVKSKNLVVQPVSGITQASLCQLMPKDQVGSHCFFKSFY